MNKANAFGILAVINGSAAAMAATILSDYNLWPGGSYTSAPLAVLMLFGMAILSAICAVILSFTQGSR